MFTKPKIEKTRYKSLLIVLILLGGYLILFLYPHQIEQFTFCPLKSVVGIPCPACGSTRATSLFLQGNFREGLLLNPLTLLTHLVLLVGLVWAVIDFARGTNTLIPALRRKWNPYILSSFLVLLILNMVWNYFKGL